MLSTSLDFELSRVPYSAGDYEDCSSALAPRVFFVSPGSLGKTAKLALGRARTIAVLPYPGGLDEKHTSAANRAFGATLTPWDSPPSCREDQLTKRYAKLTACVLALGEALLAIDRTVAAGLERDFAFFLTFGAFGLEHFLGPAESTTTALICHASSLFNCVYNLTSGESLLAGRILNGLSQPVHLRDLDVVAGRKRRDRLEEIAHVGLALHKGRLQ